MAISAACRRLAAVSALQAGGLFGGAVPGAPLRVSPGFNRTGFQPANCQGRRPVM